MAVNPAVSVAGRASMLMAVLSALASQLARLQGVEAAQKALEMIAADKEVFAFIRSQPGLLAILEADQSGIQAANRLAHSDE